VLICGFLLMILIWSAQQQYPGQALALANPALVLPGGGRISLFAALIVVAAALSYGGLFLFLQFGRWGVRMRAAGQNPLLAAQRGINLHAVYALAWGLSTLTGSLAGMLIAVICRFSRSSGRLRFGACGAIMALCQVFRSRMCQNGRTRCCASARPLLTSHCKSICAPG